MRSRLLLGVLLPVSLLVVINTVSLYRETLRAADLAYDRTLLASAKSIGELLEVADLGAGPVLRATVPYAALEAFEADNRSRMYFKVSGFAGEMVSGFEDLPAWHGHIPMKPPYAALVDFYDDRYRGEAIRVAVLLQPVAGQAGQGMATVQVAETLELRQTLARQMLWATVWRQLLLLAVISAVVSWVVQRATRPVRALSREMEARAAEDLSPLVVERAPREVQPLVSATNDVMARLAQLLARQKRFVRDASHQLRTPLAVIKTQVQTAQRGHQAPEQALAEVGRTVDGAIRLANQMLALAKLDQAVQAESPADMDLAALVRELALEMAPLFAEKALDFELHAQAPVCLRSQPWLWRELARNLVHNAWQASPPGSALQLLVGEDAPVEGGWGTAWLCVRDCGPGLDPAVRAHLFEPFRSGPGSRGSGLGLHICHEIAGRLGADLALDDRRPAGRVEGLDAWVRLRRASPG